MINDAPLIFYHPLQKIQHYTVNQKILMKLCSFILLLLTLSAVECALNKQADRAIRQAIREAIEDGLHTIDNYLRVEYWQYLNQSKLVHYNTKIKPETLNYKIIYVYETILFRANCDLDKVKWRVKIDSLGRLPSNLTEIVEKKQFDQSLFTINTYELLPHSPKIDKKSQDNKENELKKSEGSQSGSGGAVVVSKGLVDLTKKKPEASEPKKSNLSTEEPKPAQVEPKAPVQITAPSNATLPSNQTQIVPPTPSDQTQSSGESSGSTQQNSQNLVSMAPQN